MNSASDIVKRFFRDYEKGSNTGDPELAASQYAESFMFASNNGVQAVKRDDLIKVLPKRQGFVKSLGLSSMGLRSLEETRLDEQYIMVKAYWTMRVDKGGAQPLDDEISATYILHQHQDSLRIVFQLDHQDLIKRLQELGATTTKGGD